jgi:hypothetical protein
MSSATSYLLIKYVGIRLALMLIFSVVLPLASAQGPGGGLPVLSAASMPLYPRTALLAHVQGSVKIRVQTDGENISSVDEQSGPPMLVKAAKDNLRTWRFEKHDPATFLVTFDYKIEEPGGCSVENSAVIMTTPLHVEITAKAVHPCDPAARSEER